MTRLLVAPPNLPPVPDDTIDLHGWARSIYTELTRYFSQVDQTTPDSRLFGRVDKQVLTDGFVIQPNGYFIDLFAAGDVISGPIAIRQGNAGQVITLHNRSSFNLTIQANNPLVRLSSLLTSFPSYAMPPDTIMVFRWDGSGWVVVGRNL